MQHFLNDLILSLGFEFYNFLKLDYHGYNICNIEGEKNYLFFVE